MAITDKEGIELTEGQRLALRIVAGKVNLAIHQGIATGEFYQWLDDEVGETSPYEEDVDWEEYDDDDGREEFDIDERYDDDSISPKEAYYEYDELTAREHIFIIVEDLLNEYGIIPEDLTLDNQPADLNSLVDAILDIIDDKKISISDETEEFISDCRAAYVALTSATDATPTVPHYIYVFENEDGKLEWNIDGESRDERVNLLDDNRNYSGLRPLPDDVNISVPGRWIKQRYNDYFTRLEQIAGNLIELQEDFFQAEDKQSALLTTLFEKDVTSAEFLDNEDNATSLMSDYYSQTPILCKHGTFVLRTFYINSGAPWYRPYLSAIFIEEILLSPVLKKGRGSTPEGLFSSSKFRERIKTIAQKDPGFRRNTLSYELRDFKRHKSEKSLSEIFMGAYPDCRKEVVDYIWKTCMQKGEIPSIVELKDVYEPVLKKGRIKSKHPNDRSELFDPENQIYFLLASATVEMIHRLINQNVISENLLIRELHGTLKELLDTEGIISVCPDYASSDHQEIIQQIRINLFKAQTILTATNSGGANPFH